MKSQYKNFDNHGGYPQPPAVDVDYGIDLNQNVLRPVCQIVHTKPKR